MGDVLAVVAAFIGVGMTLWAAIVAFAVLFSKRAERAAYLAETEWKKTLLWGAGIAFVAGGIGLALASQPNGLGQLMGWGLLLGLLTFAVLGSAGLARIAGARVATMNPAHAPLPAIGRGAALLVASGFLPALGWFGFFPVLLCLSLGSGVRAMRREKAETVAPIQVEPSVHVAG
jgi:hypothetical protein